MDDSKIIREDCKYIVMTGIEKCEEVGGHNHTNMVET